MRNRPFIAALAANLLFWPALFLFAAVRPDYSHLTKAVSELGAVGAPHMWAWNVIGFILPGMLLALAGWGIGDRLPGSRARPWLMLGGAMVVLAGLSPADMAHRAAPETIIHLIGAMGSLLFWLVAICLLAIRIRRRPRGASIVAVIALVAVMLAFLSYDPHAPGLLQRLLFAIFFLSYIALAWIVGKQAVPARPR